ncbi:MAG: hypothetical protein E7190_08990 [Erysipelotrichaceae bacterium]|nr:hypothetical protein [Erysipelotrichaceae bacterium]
MICEKVKNSKENEKIYISCTLYIFGQFALKGAELPVFVFEMRTLDFEVGTTYHFLKNVPNIFRKREKLAQELC